MKILILCTGNAARSQMAEGLFRAVGGSKLEVFSAGIKPKALNPLAVEAMKEKGIDISGQRSKDVKEFQDEKFDVVITVCDHAKESCPVFPGARTIHWSTPDPQNLDEFRQARDSIAQRIEQFLKSV